MDYFALIVVAFLPFSIILANEPVCEDELGTEVCSNVKSEGSCDQLKYKKECAKTCLQCWSDDYWYVYKYPKEDPNHPKPNKYDVHVEKKTYAEAVEVCKGLGLQLFEPKDSIQNSEVTALAKTKGVKQFWIGIHDKNSEGEFTYESNGQKISYENWADGGPNDNHWGGEDCVVIMYDGSEQWNDLNCDLKQNSFVCENKPSVCDLNSQVNNLKGSKSKTVPGWTISGVKNGPWNIENAAQWGCDKAFWFGWDHPGATSISTTLHGKGEAILDFGNCNAMGDVTVYKNDIKISSVGAEKVDQVEFEFHDGDVLKITENQGIIQFNDLEIVECNLCSDLEDLDIVWFDAHYLNFGCIGLVKKEMNSEDAEKFCVSRGYRLVEIYDQNQQDFIVDKCTEIGPGSSIKGFWIGLKRTQGTSTWKWLDSDAIPEFTAWGGGEPHEGPNSDLLAFLHEVYGYKWVDMKKSANIQGKPICQKLN